MIRDIALFIHSVIHSSFANLNNSYYWNSTKVEKLATLVDRLSNVDDPERKTIRRILEEEKPSSILDAGCGPATEIQGYMKYGINISYLGLDRSSYMLSIAKKRHRNTNFAKGDVEEMPFQSNSFNAVLLKHILEHLPDYQKTVQEAIRVSNEIIIIDFFHRLLPTKFDIHLRDRRGFWNNWYSKSKFESFLEDLSISHYKKILTQGTANQTAEIYLVHKRQPVE